MRIWLLTLCLSFHVAGCNAFPFFQDSESANPSDSRPSEDGEDIPGYLVSLDQVSIEIQKETVVVSAEPNAIKVPTDQSHVTVGIYFFPTPTSATVIRKGELDYSVPVIAAGSTRTSEDGSFFLTIPKSESMPVILVLNDDGESTHLNIPVTQGFMTTVIKDESYGGSLTPFLYDTLKTRYPSVFSDSIPTFDNKSDCNKNDRYWLHTEQRCTLSRLAHQPYCDPSQEFSMILHLTRAHPLHPETRTQGTEVNRAVSQNYHLDQCYISDKNEIRVIFLNAANRLDPIRDFLYIPQ